MCRAFYVQALDSEHENLARNIAIQYSINSYNTGNRDGYFMANNMKRNIRTLEEKEFWDWLKKNKDWLTILGHLRLATHGNGKKWIHGWKINGYYGIHNGVLNFYGDIKEYENDSYTYLRAILEKPNNVQYTIKKIKEITKQTSGNGVIMASDMQKYLYVVSINKPAIFHLLNNSVFTVISQEDIHKFRENPEIERDYLYFYDMGKLQLEEEVREGQPWNIPEPKIFSDMSQKIENKVLVWDIQKAKAIALEKIEPFYPGGYRYNWNMWNKRYYY